MTAYRVDRETGYITTLCEWCDQPSQTSYHGLPCCDECREGFRESDEQADLADRCGDGYNQEDAR